MSNPAIWFTFPAGMGGLNSDPPGPRSAGALRSLIGPGPNRIVLVADLYLDDSGTHDAAPIITMAGYVFPAAQLEQFERQAKKLFKEESVPVFHARDFDKRNSRSPFSGWSLPRQTGFADAWLGLAKGRALRGITVSLPKARYNAVRKEHKKNQNVSTYGQCFNNVLVEVTDDQEIWDLCQREGLAVILEVGNKNNEGCVQFFNKLRKERGWEKELVRIGYAEKSDCNAIQLADYLAYYSWQYATECFNRTDDGTAALPSFLDLATNKVLTNGVLGHDFTVAPRQRRRKRDEGSPT